MTRVEAVSVPGARLWTATSGAGLPLVLAHGGPGLSDNLGPLAALVEDVALVHRYDQRGGGRSSTDGPYDVATFVADLDALRDHWGHERWVVGGHSWGAALALFYALAHPARTLGVVCVAGTGLRWGWRERVAAARLSRLTAAERAELEAPACGDAARARRLRLLWTTDFADREAADAALDRAPLYRFPRADAVADALSADWRARLDAGIEDAVRRLDVPVLVLHGEADPNPDGARELAELAPRATWAPVPAAGHTPWLEQPSAVAGHLRGWLRPLG